MVGDCEWGEVRYVLESEGGRKGEEVEGRLKGSGSECT